jgi:hypothetical protein
VAASAKNLAPYLIRPEEFAKALESRVPATQPARPVHVLILSGGGSNGAWGAGVLKGWSQSGSRPQFDLVTGISTGALISTGAFLGDDQFLEQAFTTTTNSDVQHDRFVLTIPFSDSLRTTSPLRRLIHKYLSDDKLRLVGQAGREGRRLFVGTVNLDTGHLAIVDLTRLAMDGKFDLYREAVLASASAPVLYPPVQIGEHLYVDGGVRAMLFFRGFLLPGVQAMHGRYQSLRRAAPAPLPIAPGEVGSYVYVIVNSKLGATGKCTEDCLLPIALRSLSLLTDANALTNVTETQQVAESLKFGFHLSYIPDDVEDVSSFSFDPAAMKQLFLQGEGYGKTNHWLPVPNIDDRM